MKLNVDKYYLLSIITVSLVHGLNMNKDCRVKCTTTEDFVCGNNLKTYLNPCHLQSAECMTGERIGIKQEGKCSKDDNNNDCDMIKCDKMYKPVCGTDDVQYANECIMRLTACRDEIKHLKVKNEGICGNTPTYPTTPPVDSAPAWINSNGKLDPKGILPVNTDILDKLEEINGNLVALEKKGGSNKQKLKVGLLPPRSESEIAVDSYMSMVCPSFCPRNLNPVCGSDKRTYPNTCVLKMRSCNLQRSGSNSLLMALHQGECRSSGSNGTNTLDNNLSKSNKTIVPKPTPCGVPVDCAGSASASASELVVYEPVCGSDGQTYSSKCEFYELHCKEMGNDMVTIAYEGECKSTNQDKNQGGGMGIGMGMDGKEQEEYQDDACNMFCTMDYTPVCGNDGLTYSNKCALRVKACTSKSDDLVVEYEGECVRKQYEATSPSPSLESSSSSSNSISEGVNKDYMEYLKKHDYSNPRTIPMLSGVFFSIAMFMLLAITIKLRRSSTRDAPPPSYSSISTQEDPTKIL